MENPDPAERREYCRAPLPLTIGVSVLAADEENTSGTGVSCRGRDISGGGISFYSTARYMYGNVLRIRIALPGSESTAYPTEGRLLQLMGSVMWSKKDSDKERYITGIQFLNIYEDDFNLLSDYVKNTMES
jgi:c-di-GMP-binding flagellar brake protein YcgR